MVASSQTAASQVGAGILRSGGNAADAAVAMAALNVTEPCSTGIGGDCFALHYANGSISALNGSGRAPTALSLDRVSSLSPYDANAVTVPGACAGWFDLIARHGSMQMCDILAPAIDLAQEGFEVQPVTAHFWAAGLPHVSSEELRIGGCAPRAGETFRNPGLARTFRALAKHGPDYYYRGPIGQSVVDALRARGGTMTLDDLAHHASTWEDPISTEFHEFRVWECPPNGQGLAALIALNIYKRFDVDEDARRHVMVEAMRLALDAAQTYIADPAVAAIPVARLLPDEFADERARLIRLDRTLDLLPRRPALTSSDTVYLSVLDTYGNACSFINSNYLGFGTGIVPEGWGFTLQNRGCTFSFEPGHPNALAPRVRITPSFPACSRAPRTTRCGAPSASWAASCSRKATCQVLDAVASGLTPQTAVDRPRFRIDPPAANGRLFLEDGFAPDAVTTLLARGHDVVAAVSGVRPCDVRLEPDDPPQRRRRCRRGQRSLRGRLLRGGAMIRQRRLLVAALGVVCLGAAQESGSPLVWTQSTFEDFRSGRFEDAGANAYVSRKGRVQLINKWDLNGDGFLDIVFANSHSQAEKLDATIYWGNGRDFDDRRTSPMPNDGAQHTVVADLDGDGRRELLFPNYANGTWDGMDSFVYAGNWAKYRAVNPTAGSDVSALFRRTNLPTRAAQAAAVGDLNGDGHPDVVFAMSAGFWEYRAGGARGNAYQSPSRIYWGGDAGLDAKRFTDVEAFGASDVAIGDLDNDGRADLVLANREREGKLDVPSFVYWGGKDGLSESRRSELPTHEVNAVEIADVNRDGYADIVFANGKGAVSYVYLNDRGRFSPDRRIELPSSDARDCASADVNGDGFVDVFLTNHQVAGNPMTLSYLYSGAAGGLSPDRRQPFQTTGAWGVSIGDLNGDARPEIVVSSNREHYSYDVPSHIYWNSPQGFSDSFRTSVFTHGAVGNTITDFDGDGHADVLFNNTMGGSRGLGSGSVQVYWGDARGAFSPLRHIQLPALDPYEWAAADLNDDGWTDLVVANMDEVGRRLTENFIFWGAADGFRADRRSALMTPATCGVSIADLDRDGYLDVIFNTRHTDPALGMVIYWGAVDGFVTTERTGLRNFGSGAPTIADFNADGHLDLVAHSNSAANTALIYWGDGTRGYTTKRSTSVPESHGASNSEAADLNKDGHLDLILTRSVWQEDRRAPSFVYYGSADGTFSVANRREFETVGTQVVTVGDLDKDGWLDVVCPSYNSNRTRATMSRVYLGGADGFTGTKMFELPTNSGTGSQIADYNADGRNDLLLICHRSEGNPSRVAASGDHKTDSFLYWGSAAGFDLTRRLAIPSRGAHYDSGVDLGNIYDRRFEFGYVSDAFHYRGKGDARLAWTAREPHGTTVRFQVRTAAEREGLRGAPWSGPAGARSFYERPGTRVALDASHAWVQYRAVLVSPNGSATPQLEQVRLTFR